MLLNKNPSALLGFLTIKENVFKLTSQADLTKKQQEGTVPKLMRRFQIHWDRKNVESLKRTRLMLRDDPELGKEFDELPFERQLALAERIVNMRKADITALRFYGLILFGMAGIIKYLIWG